MKKISMTKNLHSHLVLGAFLLGSTMFAQADIIHNDDVLTMFSHCIGNDCVNGESFGFDTLRLKENNLRIHFQDTSSSASFPTNDWRIIINDSSNGGGNYFAVEDSNAGRQVFRIDAGAPANSLRVDSAGDVGIGTSNPVVDLHVVSGNTPTLRLEQNGSSGFTPQTWDVAGNEANFFVRDVTNGSELPFKIKPGADTGSLYVAADGDIGMGTESPDSNLHVYSSENSNTTTDNAMLKIENVSGTSTARYLMNLVNNGATKFNMQNTSAGVEWSLNNAGNEFRISDQGDADVELILTDSGHLTINGNLTELSSRDAKENIYKVNPKEVLDLVLDLDIMKWNYKKDRADIKHIGPMAQDFYQKFRLGANDKGISTMDTSGIAIASIQALNKKLEDKTEEVENLKSENQLLAKKIARIETFMEKLTLEE